MKNTLLFLFFCVMFSLQRVVAQDVTEAEQNAALAYIEKTEALISGFRQLQLNYNQIALDRQQKEEQRKLLQNQVLAAAKKATKDFEAIAILKYDFGLRANTLAYSKLLEEIFTKDINQIYIADCKIFSSFLIFK